jgi:glyoxylase-like metal-dependent hydrolase (beta-lactamase superfamily II)
VVTSDLVVAADWYRRTELGDGITLIEEPHVSSLLSANIWHVRGRDRDLLVDCGLGVSSLRAAFPEIFEREPIVFLTHAHLDHMGSAHEFTDVRAHPLEPVESPPPGSLNGARLDEELGLPPVLPRLLINALPDEQYDPNRYSLKPAVVTQWLVDGDAIDLGDRQFRVLHMPGHTPGSTVLYCDDDRSLFSGDVVYVGGLLDELVGSNITDYVATMQRLRDLPADRTYAGHGPVLDAEEVRAIIDGYLASRGTG